MNRVQGLDSIRFICALFVLFGHMGVVSEKTFYFLPVIISHYLSAIIGLVFNGPAAVVVFFIISGFCIHFSFVKTQTINIPKYYFRRLIRIGIPAIIAGVLYIFFHHSKNVWTNTVLWSVTCEVIYYLLYPLLLVVRFHIGMLKMIIISYVITVLVLLLNIDMVHAADNSYVALGKQTWIIGLPCWLMGCYLAETYNQFKRLSTSDIWKIRIGIIFIGFLLRILKFHSTHLLASNAFSLNLFAILIFFWLGFEIMYLSNKKLFKPLEWAGSWSYSLYLIHQLTISILSYAGFESLGVGTETDRIFHILSAFLLAYIFYVFIENPAHKLAITISNKRFFNKIGQKKTQESKSV
jgi:peptidoglycan/LPS O-acetylase OafA/YrhL